MRVKVEGLKFGFGAQDLNGGCPVVEEARNKQAEANLELGSFEFELDVQEAIELAKLEGLTLKEELSKIKRMVEKPFDPRKQKEAADRIAAMKAGR